MEIQNSKILGNVYYDNSERPFIAPPIKARQELMQQKEQDYLLAKKTENELQKLQRTLPYLQQSSGVYNNFKSKIEQGLSGITPDNYEDKVLDIDQLAYDAVNKFGGNELTEEAKLMKDTLATYDKAQSEGKIVDPEMTQWYKDRVTQGHKGLQMNPDGTISRPKVNSVPYAEYVDMQKLLDERIKGWEADGSIVKNANGTINISDDLRGYLGFTEREGIDPIEIMRAANNYLKNDEKVQAYLNDKASFETRNIPPTPENVLAFMSPEVKKELLGNPNAGVDEINTAINNGTLNPTSFINEATKSRIMQNNSLFSADKYGYNKEKLNTLSDTLLIESLKAQQKINEDAAKARAGAKPVPDSNAFVSVEAFKTQQVVNPTDIQNINKVKDNLVVQRDSLQRSINSYQKQLNSNKPGYTKERIQELNAQMEGIDNQISNMEQDANSLNEIMYANASKAGFNLDSDYSNNYEANKGAAVAENINRLYSSTSPIGDKDVSVNVNNDIVMKNGKPTLTIAGQDASRYIQKFGSDYYVNKLPKALMTPLLHDKFNSDGSFGPDVVFENPEIAKTFTRVPTKQEYGNLLVTSYNDGLSDTNWYGRDKNNFQSKDGKLTVRKEVLQSLNKVREKQGEFAWTVGTPLTYLSVTGESNKESVRSYVNMEKSKNESFRTTPDQYKIQTVDGIVDLGDYVKNTLGVPNLSSQYIDWSKSNVHTLTQTDRQYGQKSGITLTLTKDGMEELNKEALKNYTATNAIKLVGVNPSKNTQAGRDEIQSTILKAYTSAKADDTAHGLNMKKEMGRVYIENSPEGRELNSLNLYTMAAGDSRTWNIRNRDGSGTTAYKIRTTAKSGEESDLLNVNYHLEQGNKVYAITNKGEKGWYDSETVEKDDTITRFTFDSPVDIKALVGGVLLDSDASLRQENKASTYVAPTNVFAQILSSPNYRINKSGNGVQVNNYPAVVKSVSSMYKGAPTNITLVKNSTGKNATFESRVPLSDLYDLKQDYPNRISNDVDYPMVNKNAVPFVQSMLNDNSAITITGGFRGEKTHNGLAESSDNSLHKYGYGLDIRNDEAGKQFLQKIVASPELKQKYGIISVMEHGSPVHIHIEFSPTAF